MFTKDLRKTLGNETMKRVVEDTFRIPNRCLVCTYCRYSDEHKMCMYGGPYYGYQEEEEGEEPHSDGPKDTKVSQEGH